MTCPAGEVRGEDCDPCVCGGLRKLYEVPRRSVIMVYGQKFAFCRLDGMYSLCYNESGEIVHIYASEEVEVLESESYSELISTILNDEG